MLGSKANSLTSVGWYDPIKTTGYINRSQPSVWLTRNHLFQMLWFDLLETKDCLFLLLSWGKQMLIGWPLVVGVRILKTNRGSIAEAAVWLWFSIFFHNAMLGHTHYEKLEVYFATYSSIYFSCHQTVWNTVRNRSFQMMTLCVETLSTLWF